MYEARQRKETASRIISNPKRNAIQCAVCKNNSKLNLKTDSRPTIQRFIFIDGTVVHDKKQIINKLEKTQKVNDLALTKQQDILLEKLIISEKQYNFPELITLLNLTKKDVWKTTGSTRPDKSDVTGKIGAKPGSEMELRDIGKTNNLTIQDVDVLDIHARMELEENIGSMLLNSQYIKNVAQQIHEITAQFSETTDDEIRAGASKDVERGWGGAYGFMTGQKGVDESVYATTQHFTKSSNYVGFRESYPEGNILHDRISGKKPMGFDDKIENIPPAEWPDQTKYEFKRVLSSQGYTEEDINRNIDIIQKMHEDPKCDKQLILNYFNKNLRIKQSVSQNLSGESTSFTRIPYQDRHQFRQSNSGRQYNVITDKEYRRRAEELVKPVLSGPSGTAFRYLKSWEIIKGKSGGKGPTMNEARLVILANLLPPNGHHSYHEIMDASVNVGGLQYNDANGYTDLGLPQVVRTAAKLVQDGRSHVVRQPIAPKGRKHFSPAYDISTD